MKTRMLSVAVVLAIGKTVLVCAQQPVAPTDAQRAEQAVMRAWMTCLSGELSKCT